MDKIKTIWRNNDNEIRNGWWILLFVGLIALSRPLFSFVNSNLKQANINETWPNTLPVLFITVIT